VMRTHREVIDHVWGILHPSARFVNGDENSENNSRHSVSSPSSSMTSSNQSSLRRQNRNSHHRPPSSSSTRSSQHQQQNQQHQHRSEGPSGNGSNDVAPPLPPPSRHMQRGNSMHRSHSVQDSGLRPPNFTHLPPLPPYSQRSCSSDALIRANHLRRPHLRTVPSHGPHMASTATFNPYLSPSISETGSDGEEDVYNGGSECYVTMSSCSESTYLPSTQSDPGTTGRAYRLRGVAPNMPLPPQPGSESSGAPSELYMTSLDSECSGASYRVNSPPPLYREVDDAHSVPLNFDSIPPPAPENDSTPNSAAISLVSPIIPIASSEPGNATFDFDAAAVLSRTQELEGELQRLRVAMTCRLCKQDPIGATFCPCGHTVCCYQCAQRMHSCWECNETVTSVQKMLLTR
jgi:E3 ubiquitin-protein ligase MYLIP